MGSGFDGCVTNWRMFVCYPRGMNLDSELGMAAGKPQQSAGNCTNDATMMVGTAAFIIWWTNQSDRVVWWHGLLGYPLLLLLVWLNATKVAGSLSFLGLVLGETTGLVKSTPYMAFVLLSSYLLLCAATLGVCILAVFASWKMSLVVFLGIQAIYYGVIVGGAALMRWAL